MTKDYSKMTDNEINKLIVANGAIEEAYTHHMELAFTLPLREDSYWDIRYFDDGSFDVRIYQYRYTSKSVRWETIPSKLNDRSSARVMCETWLLYTTEEGKVWFDDDN